MKSLFQVRSKLISAGLFSSFVKFLTLITLLVSADQWSKSWVSVHLQMFQRIAIFGQKILVISHTVNKGLAFDRYSWVPEPFISLYVLYLPTWVLMIFMSIAAWRWRSASIAEKVGYCLVFAGGASNLFDHWQSSYVIDTLQLYLGHHNFLPFNLADVGLITGVLLTIQIYISLLWKDLFRPVTRTT